MPLDPLAERACGVRADDYETHRAGWPDGAVEACSVRFRAGAEATVVDLAAGTGKLTRGLVRRVARVIAVEPSAEMRRALRTRVPDADVLDGTADAMPIGDASADAVTVGEAFHWFARPAAVAELLRREHPSPADLAIPYRTDVYWTRRR
jgi:ubiquinone/menaquinone biosynthesis C-methylase UbiE